MTDKELLDLCVEVHKRVHAHFVWTSDSEVWNRAEYWSQFADAVERGDVTREDCDGFAMTCLELLARTGIEPKRLRLVACFLRGMGHAIAAVDIGNETWILDNRYRSGMLLRWGEAPYRYHSAMRYSAPGKWRRIKEKAA